MRSLSGDLLLQRLGEQPDDKLHKRLYNAIRTSILDGSLPPSSRLPARAIWRRSSAYPATLC